MRIEEAVQGIDGIKKMTSTASEGRGSVRIEVLPEYDVREVLEDVKARVDAIDTFPEETERPVTQELTSRFQVINISISGDADRLTLKRLGERVRDELTALPEISQASCRTFRPTKFRSRFRSKRCAAGGSPSTPWPTRCAAPPSTCPEARSKPRPGKSSCAPRGQAYTGLEYEALPLVARPDGTKILLRDVAQVIDGFEGH